MVILGLGSNIADRFHHLRQALRALRHTDALQVIRVSPLYRSQAQVPDQAPSSWRNEFLNLAVACNSQLTPQALLGEVKKLEAHLGRGHGERWSPRVIDIDILAWGHEVVSNPDLVIPHQRLVERPFALWPLLDVWPDWSHPQLQLKPILQQWGDRPHGDAPFGTTQMAHRLDFPPLMGVVNVTPDSFTDGGYYLDPKQALSRIQACFQEGAEFVDIGAESTHPQNPSVQAREEWQRLQPVLQAVQQYYGEQLGPKISIDTRHAQVAQNALNYGIQLINDVTAGTEHSMIDVVAQSGVDYVLMHHLGVPPDPGTTLELDTDPVQAVYQWAVQKIDHLVESGIAHHQLIFDPGIGFGKTAGQSFELLRRLHTFHALRLPILASYSRKGFLKHLTATERWDRDWETLAVSAGMLAQGLDLIRVHNVTAHARVFKTLAMLS